MWIRRRTQPSTGQSLAGFKLTDERLIAQEEAAYFTADQLAIPIEQTNEPALEAIAPAGDDDE